VARKAKKKVSSLSYTMKALYKRTSTIRISTPVISIIAIVTAIFLFGGGMYNIIMKPLPSIYYGGRFYFLYPELGAQFIFDSVISMTLYSLGIIGLIVIYQSTKFAYRPRQAYMMLLVGAVFLLVTYIYLEVVIQLKLSG